jgi:uncharacterized sporulation protein YeaH/YhbH (DUF444 family)
LGLRIHNDHSRFNDVVRGRIKKNLRDFIKSGEFISKQGNEKIAVPIARVDLPQFRFLDKSQGGVGQGEGQKGDPLSKDDKAKNANDTKAGSEQGEHAIEVEVSLSDLADMLGEELGLPRIERRGHNRLKTETLQYTGIHTSGPNALRHFKRSFKNALKRQIAMGIYDRNNPVIIPIKEDMRFRSFRRHVKPESNAVIIYMMDVSGSMGDEQKEIVRIESFWIDTWLRRHYDGIDCRYIIHDAMAKEVDRNTFFHTRESGGTMISSAYRLCADMIRADYPSNQWNIYPFHFSDGDNWSVDDTRLCVGLLKKRILPWVNQFSYGQVESPYGSGQFIKDLREQLKNYDKLALSEVKDKEGIYQSIRDFLAHGK